MPESLIPFGLKILTSYETLMDKRNIQHCAFSNVPPPKIRLHTAGVPSLDTFLKSGKRISEDLLACLKTINRDINSFNTILDFGCGCGRIVLWLQEDLKNKKFFGTDVDEEAIKWCAKNLECGKFTVNKPLPPLRYENDFFDLIYSISIFTHLVEDWQNLWLKELNRIMKIGAIAVITLHGKYAFSISRHKNDLDLDKERFAFIQSKTYRGVMPNWYQGSYQTENYVLTTFSKYFKILNFIPQGVNGFQDVVILQKMN